MLAVEGTFRDGRIELTEVPTQVREARVVVVFLTSLDDLVPAEGELLAGATRQAAAERLLARMKSGLDFGDSRRFDREELYDRVLRNNPSKPG